jgi:hypothetical protein
MHRLQISLPAWQSQFLAERARRDGVSVAEVVRRLVEREAELGRNSRSVDSIWEIAGIGEDSRSLIDGIPVSERPELYLAEAAAGGRTKSKRRATRKV